MTIDYIKESWSILIVDDVQVHRFLMKSGLERVNPCLKITEAKSCAEATALLDDGKYDAVVSDWNMPSGDGGLLAKWMRQRPHYKRVPFIMISSNQESEDIISAFMELGVDGYVVKPFTPHDFYAKIKLAIENRR
jgi:CheY-like chemotaxis protein